MRLKTLIRSTFILAVSFACLVGCSKDDDRDAKLVPVHGKLTEMGGKDVTNGMLEFRPAGESVKGSAIADVGADGSFVVRTQQRQQARPGMMPGRYAVSYFPPMGEDQMAEPVPLPGEITIPDAGFPNTSPLRLELPRRRR